VASRYEHQPVLLQESLSCLEVVPGAIVVDGTVGGGGHAAAILERSAPDGRLIALDLDDEALAAARDRLAPFGERALLVHASFRHLDSVLREQGVSGVDAVLLDLGVSSHQLDTAARGFRFGADTADETPLDMRMDPTDGPTAADLLRTADADELAHWFWSYADLPGSRRLARAIVAARERGDAPETAADLLAIVREARVGGGRRHHPGTLIFQALRIAVNDELRALEEGLDAAIAALRPGGRLAVIAYHSAEDRIVKHRLRAEVRGCICPPEVPRCICGRQPRVRLVMRRPVKASDEEVHDNPRARSARLRAAERLAEAA
jgi:16S rRNA (cytosine1402-N4)-methyltransferase